MTGLSNALGRAARHEWSLDPDFLTVNHGSYGATPRAVLAVQAEWRARLEAQPTRFFTRDYFPAIRAAAGVLAEFLHVAATDLAFVQNATTGCNAVLRSLRFAPGDEILVLGHVYNAVRNTVRHVAEQVGACVVVAEIPFPRPSADAVLESLESAITPRTRIAVLDHITSASALVLPIARMVALCQQRGVPVLVDGAHAPGQVALDLTALGADWYTGNCHKWLMAPKGCAFLHARADRQSELHPGTISHGFGQGFTAEFDWTGTADPSAFLALPATLEFFARLGGPALMARNRALALEASALLAARFGTEVGALPDMAGAMGLVRIPLRDAAPEDAQALRDRLGKAWTDVPVIALNDALWLRISAAAYNENSDYVRLGDLLSAMLA
jgi:isopenicillin-N epimerase